MNSITESQSKSTWNLAEIPWLTPSGDYEASYERAKKLLSKAIEREMLVDGEYYVGEIGPYLGNGMSWGSFMIIATGYRAEEERRKMGPPPTR